jgi:transcriptional regulator with XRE-family HTH domain
VAKKTGRRKADRVRGGRPPGKWELVDPLEFRTWRQQQRLSRARLASLLDVSATSIQNWDTGNAVPSRKYQERLAELMKRPPGALEGAAPPRRPALATGGDGDAAAISATGAIVAAYVKGAPEMDQEDLLLLIQTVRSALS